MAEATVRLACQACGATYSETLTVTSEPCPDSDGVHVIVEMDDTDVLAWCAAHRAPYVVPTRACA